MSIEDVCKVTHDRQYNNSGESAIGIKVDQLDRKLVAKMRISSTDATKQVELSFQLDAAEHVISLVTQTTAN